jgi:signal transduction histidine kinase/DNA-binding response OmpR family regulator
MTPNGTTKILVVDDLPEKLFVYRAMLDELGQTIIEALSGEEALKQVLHHDFSVILLDVNMPTLDGFETARLIRTRKRSMHTPIIFLTAFADEVRTMEGYAHGAVDFMMAPVVPEILRAKIRVFVELFRLNQQVMRQAEERIALAEERTKRLAAEQANRNLSFFATCGAVLGQSLDFTATLHDLARLGIPYLADTAYVAVPQSDGASWTAVAARKTADDQVTLDKEVERSNIPSHLAGAIDRTLMRRDINRLAAPDPHAPFSLVRPLKARGQAIGVLALNRDPRRGPFTRTEEDVTENLVSRGAVALDNAQLYLNLREADRQRNEFLSMLAHELRNPLAPIRNAVELLRSDGLAPAEMARSRDMISRQVGHLIRLVDDLLDASRITQGKIRLKLQAIEVAKVADQAVEASRPEIEARRHRLYIDMPNSPLHVFGDSTRLAQVLTNLMNNAAKYTPAGGEIWFSVRAVDDGSVVFCIRDSGIGIPTEMLSRVFDLFTQVDRTLDRSEGGLGIGLTVVRRLVEMHNGRVEVRSAGIGHGCEFTVIMPHCEPVPIGPMTVGEHSNGIRTACARCQLLIVDDNRDSADSLAMLLKLSGFSPQVAYDGHAAVALAKSLRPEVVLLDIGLPGLNGYEVARRLRADDDTKAAFLVAITGYGQEENGRLAQSAGFNCHFVKPVVIGDLLSAITSHAVNSPTSATEMPSPSSTSHNGQLLNQQLAPVLLPNRLGDS